MKKPIPRDQQIAETGASIEALMPEAEFIRPAWLGHLMFAIGNPDILAAFRADTGNNYQPTGIPINDMIDQATGVDAAFILEFIKWTNKNLWGEVNGRACNGDEPELGESIHPLDISQEGQL